MRVALAQMRLRPSIAENADRGLQLMRDAARHGAELICFPELQFSPFFPQHAGQDGSNFLLRLDSPHVRAIQELCKTANIVAVPNLYLEEGSRRFDASPVLDADGEILGVSKMVHIVQAPCFYEQDYYTPSDTGFHVYDTEAGKIGVVICFDRHYPESIRSCAIQDAELVVIPTANLRDEPLELYEWELRMAAMQNGLFIAMCNRVGSEGDVNFCGESIIVDPNGDVVTKAGDSEQIVYADIDLGAVSAARTKRPFLELRRPEAFVM